MVLALGSIGASSKRVRAAKGAARTYPLETEKDHTPNAQTCMARDMAARISSEGAQFNAEHEHPRTQMKG